MLAAREVGFKCDLGLKGSLSRPAKCPIYNVMQARIGMAGTAVFMFGFGAAAAQRPGSVEISGVGVWHNKTLPHDGLRAFGGGGRLGIWIAAGFEVEGEVDLTRPTN